MPIYQRYILRQTGIAIAIGYVILTFVIWLPYSLRYLRYIFQFDSSLGDFLLLIALVIPLLSKTILPIALFVGIVLTYNRFWQDGEFVVLQNCGIRSWDLARPALILGGIVTLISYSITLYFEPISQNYSKNLAHVLKQATQLSWIDKGQFYHIGQYTLYVQDRHDAVLKGIFVYDPVKPSTLTAQTGWVVEDDGRSFLIMENGRRFEKNDDQWVSLSFEQYSFALDQLKPPLSEYVAGADAISTLALIRKLRDPNLDPTLRYRMIRNLNQRFAKPLIPLSTMIIALIGMMAGGYQRRGKKKAIALTTIALTALIMFDFYCDGQSKDNPWFLPLLYVPHLLVFGVGCWMLYHQKFSLSPASLCPKLKTRSA